MDEQLPAAASDTPADPAALEPAAGAELADPVDDDFDDVEVLEPEAAGELAGSLAGWEQTARGYVRDAKAEATRRAYRSDLADFADWCVTHDVDALPAAVETVRAYLADLAGRRKIATVQRRVAAISQAHTAAGHPTPTAEAAVRLVLQGIRRTHGPDQPIKRAEPAVTRVIRALVAPLQPDVLIDVRDRALLLLGFAGAFRRSELVALQLVDVVPVDDGLRITVRRSKSDQAAAGMVKGIPYGRDPDTCPVTAYQHWTALAGIVDGPVFRSVPKGGKRVGASLSSRAVADIVKGRAAAAGYQPSAFSPHSLRAGLATAAAAAGVPERKIMDQTGHRSLAVMRGYIREGELFRGNAAGEVGL